MFIKYEDIKDEVLIDCRTKEEFELMPLFDKNIPIIDKNKHMIIKKFYPCAIFVIIYGLLINKYEIKEKLIKYSNNKKSKIIVGCSRGRLRSPIMYIYAKSLGIDVKILYKGIKRFYYK